MTTYNKIKLKNVIHHFITNSELKEIFKTKMFEINNDYIHIHFSTPAKSKIKYNRLDDICIGFIENFVLKEKCFKIEKSNIEPFVINLTDEDSIELVLTPTHYGQKDPNSFINKDENSYYNLSVDDFSIPYFIEEFKKEKNEITEHLLQMPIDMQKKNFIIAYRVQIRKKVIIDEDYIIKVFQNNNKQNKSNKSPI